MKVFGSPKIIFILSGLLVISAAFNWYLYRKLIYYYIMNSDLQLNPVNLKEYNSDLIELPVTADKNTIVFFGDSRAASWRNPQIEGFQFFNRGIVGETSAQAFLRFDHHVTDLKPQFIVVQVGVNDLRMLALPPKERKDIIENCKANIWQIVDKSTEIGATVILTTIFPIARGNVPLRWRNRWAQAMAIATGIEEINTYIRSLKSQNIIIFDTYSLLEKEGRTKPEYVRDLLHINSEGYKLLNNQLEKILKAMKVTIN